MFEIGKTYTMPKGIITVSSRTRCYIDYSGTINGEKIHGKKKIHTGLFGHAESVWFMDPATKGTIFCFAK